MKPTRTLLKPLLVAVVLSGTVLTPLHLLAQREGQPSRYQSFPKTWQARLDQFTKGDDGTVQTATTPGVLMVLDSPRWGNLLGTSGYADIDKEIPPSPEMHYRIGSMSKVYTALTVLSLEQDGLIELDDTVDQYLTGDLALDPKYHPEKITIADCLQHTSGQGSYVAAPFFKDIPFPNSGNVSVQELMKQNNLLSPLFGVDTTYANPFQIYQKILLAGQPVGPKDIDDPTSFEQRYPGWFYSNSGYLCLGIIIEKASGQPIHVAMKERVMDKLGLQNTFFATDEKMPEPMMHGYSRLDAAHKPLADSKWVDRTIIDPSYAWSAGAVVSTPNDMLKFIRGIFKSEKVLNNATKEKWLSFVTGDLMIPEMDYGVGACMQNQQPYGMLRGHGGSIPSFNNLCEYLPDSNTFFVIVVNTWDGDQGQYTEEIVMDAVMPLVTASVTTPNPPNNGTLKSKKRRDVELKWQDGRIYGDHNVYFGTDRDQVLNAAKPDQQTKHNEEDKAKNRRSVTVEVEPGKTYYWRVDTVPVRPFGPINGLGWSFYDQEDASKKDLEPITGPVWSFTVGKGKKNKDGAPPKQNKKNKKNKKAADSSDGDDG